MAFAAFNGQAQDLAGNAVATVSIEVRRESDNTLATLFEDREGATPLGNPFVNSPANNGHFRFHVAGGAYRVRAFTGSGDVKVWRYVAIGTSAETDISSPVFENFTIASGLVVGFDGEPITRRIQLGDADNFWSFNEGNPLLSFDDGDQIIYGRDENVFGFRIGGVDRVQVDSVALYPGDIGGSPEEFMSLGKLGSAWHGLFAGGVATLSGFEGDVTPTFDDTPMQVHVGSVTDAATALLYWADDFTGPKETFFKSRGATPNSNVVVQADDILGGLEFFGADGIDFAEGGRIQCHADGTPGNNDMPGRIIIRTTPDGSQTSVERMRVDRLGNMTLWGSETAGVPSFNDTPIQAHCGSISTAAAAFLYWFNDAFGPVHTFLKSRGSGVNSFTVVQADDILGEVNFSGADGTDFARAARIRVTVDGTPGNDDMPGRIGFFTSPDGSQTPAERMRIANGGNVYFPGVGTTGTPANAFLDSGSSPANELLRSTSSGRYKRDVEDLQAEYADKLLSLRPVWYRSAINRDRQDWSWYGLIAEEVADIDPRLVHWGYAEEDWELVEVEDGKGGPPGTSVGRRLKKGAHLKPEGVTYDRLTVLLLSIVQRHQQRLKALENPG